MITLVKSTIPQQTLQINTNQHWSFTFNVMCDILNILVYINIVILFNEPSHEFEDLNRTRTN